MRTEPSTEIVRADKKEGTPSEWVLSGLDRANLLLVIRGTWVFDTEPDVERVKRGLAQILGCYPHLAGRMVAGKSIALNDAGVPFTVASSHATTVQDVCARPPSANAFSSPLSTSSIKRGRAAPMSVRLTRLADGWVLGVRCSHACLDGAGFYTMVQSWARAAAGRPFDPPVLDQSLVPTAAGRSKAEAIRAATERGWKKVSILSIARMLPPLVLGRMLERAPAIHFGPAALERIRQAAADESGCATLSTNEALSAHLTRLWPMLHRIPDGTPVGQVTVVDGRMRLAGVPSAFAGNAAFVVATFRGAAGAGRGDIARQVHEALAPIRTSPSTELLDQVRLGLDLLRHRVLMLPYDLAGIHLRPPTTVYLNSFSKLPIYDVDFTTEGERGAPVFAIPHNLPDPVLLWPGPPAIGGIDLFLTGVAARAVKRLAPHDPWWNEVLPPDR